MIYFGPASTYPLPCHYVLEGNKIVNSDSNTDFGILVSNNLNFTTHSYRVIHVLTSFFMLSLTVTFLHVVNFSAHIFCPLLEYCSQIWSPYILENINIIESVQRSFTRPLPGLSFLFYSDRLIKTNLPSLELERL